jgi:hypothetical protein
MTAKHDVNRLTAPKARNVKAWASDPGGKQLISEALKARNVLEVSPSRLFFSRHFLFRAFSASKICES